MTRHIPRASKRSVDEERNSRQTGENCSHSRIKLPLRYHRLWLAIGQDNLQESASLPRIKAADSDVARPSPVYGYDEYAMKKFYIGLLLILPTLASCGRPAIKSGGDSRSAGSAQDIPSALATADVVEAKRGLVVSVSQPASEVGLAVLKQGGNAVDAAVATAFALAVTYPEAGNIGGGGFMLVRPAEGGDPVCVDYRETAPAASSVDMFVNQKSHLGHRLAGVPGTVRGLQLAHKKWGKLDWSELVAPAIKLAHDGFEIDAAVATGLNSVLDDSAEFAELHRVFGKPGDAKWQAGDRLVQMDLAQSLEQIAQSGSDGFYKGPLADKLVAEMKQGNGLIVQDDLNRYEAKLRPAVHGTYRGYDVFGPPPPSSGGIVLVEMLNILERFDLKSQGRWSPQTVHVMIEAMRRAYRDRARYLGDPDFAKIPDELTSKEYARELASKIDLKRATPSADLAGDIELADESTSTTHFSIVDADGMAVANTYTLEQKFGCRVVVRGAGYLLNNQMGDFNWRPGHTDRKGAIGTAANTIGPGKRMLSAQTPVIVTRDNRLVLVSGSPGGRTIVNTVLCVLLNVLEFDMDLAAAIDAPRLHQQWFPDRVQFEGLKQREHRDLIKQLRAMGHEVTAPRGTQGDAHSIQVGDGSYIGAADKRISGFAAGH